MPPARKNTKKDTSATATVSFRSSGGVGRVIFRLLSLLLAPYLLGVALSPHLVPADILTEHLAPLLHVISVSSAPSNSPVGASSSSSSHYLPPAASPEQPATTAAAKHLRVLLSSRQAPMYRKIAKLSTEGDPFNDVDVVIHRNGEVDACARQIIDEGSDSEVHGERWSLASQTFVRAANLLHDGGKPLYSFDKYDFDAAMTHALAGSPEVTHPGETSLLEDRGMECGPQTWTPDADHLTNVASVSSMLKFCDMGFDRTPVLPDHTQLVRVPRAGSFPCHFHTREGLRITSLEQLAEVARAAAAADAPPGECLAHDRDGSGNCSATDENLPQRRKLHLYAVPAGRIFIFAPKYVGEIFDLPHVKMPQNLPVWLEVMSLQPKVFDIFNFFDRQESAQIVDKAMKETSETHRIKRSSTGASGYNLNSQRTSENGFDTHGKQAQSVKRRCMDVLGFDTYSESFTDGLQVLRYNISTAYVPHLDWIDDPAKKEEHNYDSAGVGSNRFATILLYMTDLEEGDGGETVFTKGWSDQPVEERVEMKSAIETLRESGDVKDVLREGSWEERMVAQCRTRLSVRPHSSRAVLFYSQTPDGTVDNFSLHGGCPVIRGEKWAANLWVWNAPRGGFPGAPMNDEVVRKNREKGKVQDDGQRKASFVNEGTDPTMNNAKLYFQDTFWGDLGHGDPMLNVNTFEGHKWFVRVDGRIVRAFAIDNRHQQQFVI